MATLTTYTQALQHLDTQEVEPYSITFDGNRISLVGVVSEQQMWRPDLHRLYRVRTDTYDVIARLHTTSRQSSSPSFGWHPPKVLATFKPLDTDGHIVAAAVLTERARHEAKPAGAFSVKDYFGGTDINPEREALARINQIAAEYAAKTATPRFAYDGHSYWREGEGNNP
ncbi:hypothetical protein HQO42_14990 [Rhodococcus fascians]|nr:hypothetical protein [Rhodococcus fascians]MBY4237760.1 hypothetical protein [Rhodococcus fascians]MBY4253963.1 hypothetical protein [Rhodococcus fascians]MBY4269166.1 hypothetical protein [Rhodococcus fascians]